MNIPASLQYSKDHEWVQTVGENTILVGITDYAQSKLGDLVFINLPQKGDVVTAGDPFCDVESVKAVSDVMSPCTGLVAEVNTVLEEEPQRLNEDPYGAWIAKISDITGFALLMTAAEYEAFLQGEQ